MTDTWILLSFLSAFGQALGWALKKRTLENKGINNTLGLVSFFTAGVILFLLWGLTEVNRLPSMSPRFILASLVVIGVNILAVWAIYRVLDQAALSVLMPFVAVTALFVVPIEYVLRGVLPNVFQVYGIALVVTGATFFATIKRPTKEVLTVAGYFATALLCYSIAPPFQAVAVEESGSGLFSAGVFHIGIAMGFFLFRFLYTESQAIGTLQEKGEWGKTILLMVAAGAVLALFENGPATVALESAKASEVFSLKRTMPLFALILGIWMFREKVTIRHFFGTTLLVGGSILIVWFR